jgi:hypothetical protein
MASLYKETYVMMFSQASLEKRQRDLANDAFLLSPQEFISSGEELITKLSPFSNGELGLLSMALIEMAGNVLLHIKEIETHLQEGTFVLQDSFGYKHVLKEWLLSQFCRTGSISTEDDHQIGFFADIFSQHLNPDIGVFLRGAPELALRYAGGRQLGLVEDLASVGRPGDQGFTELQNACNVFFERFAVRNGWSVVAIEGASIEENIETVYQAVSPRIRAANRTGLV